MRDHLNKINFFVLVLEEEVFTASFRCVLDILLKVIYFTKSKRSIEKDRFSCYGTTATFKSYDQKNANVKKGGLCMTE